MLPSTIPIPQELITVVNNIHMRGGCNGGVFSMSRLQGDGDTQQDDVGLCQINAAYFSLPKATRQQIIEKTFLELDEFSHQYPDAGSTFSVALLNKNADGSTTIDCAHVGDSPILLTKYTGQDILIEKLIELHHFENASELKRILEFKKRKHCPSIFTDIDDETCEVDEKTDPKTISYYGNDNKSLMMTRSLGDKILGDIGIIPLPDFKSYSIKEAFPMEICVMSDGVTDFLDDDQMAFTLATSDLPATAAALTQAALQSKRFKKTDNTSAVTYCLNDQAVNEPVALLIADGHGGHEVANHSIQHFLHVFSKHLKFAFDQQKEAKGDQAQILWRSGFFEGIPPASSAGKQGITCLSAGAAPARPFS
jgi:serine/threonine protein phosphatase PrpC